MADISDVEQAIANNVASALYPDGISQSSVLGVLCRVYRGWPNSATLNADLSANMVNVTIAADNDSGRITTRYLPEWRTSSSQPGLMGVAGSESITLAGAPNIGDVVGALLDGNAYAYRIRPGDTPELVTANLNHLIQSNYMSSVTGPVIAIPGARLVRVRVVCDQASFNESRRQEKDIRVIFWCPNPLIRDVAVSVVDAALSQTNFLSLIDGSKARMIYRNTSSYDQAQNAQLYRRDLIYTVEYPTIAILQCPAMLFGGSDINGNITYG